MKLATSHWYCCVLTDIICHITNDYNMIQIGLYATNDLCVKYALCAIQTTVTQCGRVVPDMNDLYLT